MWRSVVVVALWTSVTPAFAGGRMPDPEQMRERAEHVFDTVDATPRQRTQAWRLVEGVIEEMRGYREEGRALRERFGSAFVAERIDRNEMRSIHTDLVDLFDRATDRGLELIVSVAEVFTPAQRQTMHDLHRLHSGWNRQQDDHTGGSVPAE